MHPACMSDSGTKVNIQVYLSLHGCQSLLLVFKSADNLQQALNPGVRVNAS